MSELSPFFSIVIPTYNRAHLIKTTIESVQAQTFTNWELLLVDDGSKDNTKEVVEGINDARVKYIYQANAERSAARNNGINKAIGKFVCFLDSDDMYLPIHLETLHNYLISQNEPTCLLFTNCKHLVDSGEITVAPIIPLAGIDPRIYFLKHSVIPARVCIHRNILQEYNFRTDIVIVEDSVLWISIAQKYPVIQLEAATIIYRLHDENSVNIKNNCFLPRLQGLQKLFEDTQNCKGISTQEQKVAKSVCYLGIARHHQYHHRKFKMIINLVISIFYDIKSPQTKSKIFMIYSALFKK